MDDIFREILQLHNHGGAHYTILGLLPRLFDVSSSSDHIALLVSAG